MGRGAAQGSRKGTRLLVEAGEEGGGSGCGGEQCRRAGAAAGGVSGGRRLRAGLGGGVGPGRDNDGNQRGERQKKKKKIGGETRGDFRPLDFDPMTQILCAAMRCKEGRRITALLYINLNNNRDITCLI